MRFKRLPSDFAVEEEIALQPAGGPFALYRLRKQSLGTREALDAVAHKWNLPTAAISFAGLKDKHALTTQFITVHGRPKRGLAQTNVSVEYVGQTERPIHASDITANRFAIVIRDLSPVERDSAFGRLAAVVQDGSANYFDNQRFGSLGISGEFIAKAWCLGDYEKALWLAIAEENARDRPPVRDEKRILREHWGRWKGCDGLVGRSPQSRVIAFLVDHPADFRRAIALVRQDLRSIWLAAYQSHLWNAILAELIRRTCNPVQGSHVSIGRREVPLFVVLNESQRQELQQTCLPLPSARLHLEEGRLNGLYTDVLAEERIELRQIRVKYPRDSFFSKGERAAVFQPGELTHQAAADDLYPGREKLTLRFTLPRGAYATILIKRLFGPASAEMSEDD